jgi:predicted kinase
LENSNVEIWASIGITKNLGNYESLRLDAGARVKASSENDEKAWAELWRAVDEQIESRLRELDSENGS